MATVSGAQFIFTRPAIIAFPVCEYVQEMITVTPASLRVLRASSVSSSDGTLGIVTVKALPSASFAVARPTAAAFAPPSAHIDFVNVADACRNPTLMASTQDEAPPFVQRLANGDDDESASTAAAFSARPWRVALK